MQYVQQHEEKCGSRPAATWEKTSAGELKKQFCLTLKPCAMHIKTFVVPITAGLVFAFGLHLAPPLPPVSCTSGTFSLSGYVARELSCCLLAGVQRCQLHVRIYVYRSPLMQQLSAKSMPCRWGCWSLPDASLMITACYVHTAALVLWF